MQVKWEAFLRKREIQNIPEQFRDIAESVEHFFKEPLREIQKENHLKNGFEMEL